MIGLPVFSVLQSGGIDRHREVCDATGILEEGHISRIFTRVVKIRKAHLIHWGPNEVSLQSY